MKTIIVTIAGLLFLSFFCASAAAQPSCPATATFTATSTDPVVLTIAHATTRMLSGPFVHVAGTVITIRQIDMAIPPPPGPSHPASCNIQTVSLGTLPPGNYTVHWHYSVAPAMPNGPFQDLESFSFAFAHAEFVPALSGPALLALIVLLGAVSALVLRR